MPDEEAPDENGEEDIPQEITVTARTFWEAVEQLFGVYYNGVLVRGALLLDIYDVDGKRNFAWEVPDDTSPWDIRSLGEELIRDVDYDGIALRVLELASALADGDEDDEREGDLREDDDE